MGRSARARARVHTDTYTLAFEGLARARGPVLDRAGRKLLRERLWLFATLTRTHRYTEAYERWIRALLAPVSPLQAG